MKIYSKNSLIIILLILSVGFGMVYWLSLPQDLTHTEVLAEPEPIAQVETIKLHKGEIKETLNTYGVVLPLPDKLITLSVPYISKVDKMQVNQGQFVQQGDVLLTLKPGAMAKLQLEQAHSELNAANSENKLLRERIQLQLATKQDLVASRLRVKRAKVMLKNLAGQGIAKEQAIKAEHDGIVYQVNVQQGQIVAAGVPLLQVVDQNQWMVRLGIEPEDYRRLQVNQQVFITPVNTPVSEPVKGRIEMITQQIDPTTRLLNVFVRPELNQTLLINDFVKGQIIISSSHVFLVPRQAVLPEGGGYSLFSVENGRAIKHTVQLGLENDSQLEVTAADLNALDVMV
ncbi:MAG: membrane fusion protein, multidrug efflux system [Methyloprofundus sp.]|nr:MAG: membrane fusion protein, multidrug efflux system [Methyloprofundus sp.]